MTLKKAVCRFSDIPASANGNILLIKKRIKFTNKTEENGGNALEAI